MTQESKQTPDDILDRATNELRNESPLSGPTAELLSGTTAALASQISHSPEILRHDTEILRKQRMSRIFRLSSLAAAVMILVGGFVFFYQSKQNSAFAYEQAIAQARKATSVTYHAVIDYPGGLHYEENRYVRGDLTRSEVRGSESNGPDGTIKPSYDAVLISDYKNRIMMSWNNKTKNAGRQKMEENSDSESPLDEVLKIMDLKSEYIGEETLNGRKTKVYRHAELNGKQIAEGDTAKIWVDAKTKLLVKAQQIFDAHDPKKRYTAVFDNYKWNTPLKNDLFAMNAPEGFKLVKDIEGVDVEPASYFVKVIENVRKATSVTYTQKTEIDGKPIIQMTTSARGDWVRMEFSKADENVNVENTKTGDWWTILPKSKLVIKSKLSKAPKKSENLLEQLTSITDMKSAVKIGEETIDGKKVILYHVSDEKLKGTVVKVWVDPATNLPLKCRFETSLTDPQSGEKRTVIGTVEKFTWNTPLKNELFEVPSGYRVIEETDGNKVQAIINKESGKQPKIFIETDGECEIEIVDTDGKPILGVDIFVILHEEENGWDKHQELRHVARSSNKAMLQVRQKTTFLKIWIRKEHYVPLFTYWGGPYLKDNPKLPKTLKFTMQRGTKIGGIVQDEQGKPIEGAQIEVQYLQSAASTGRITIPSTLVDEEMGAPAPITDAKGRWSLDTVPPGEKTRLQLKISHPDFPGDKSWDDVSPKPELTLSDLRAEKAVYVMKKNPADKKAAEEKKVGN